MHGQLEWVDGAEEGGHHEEGSPGGQQQPHDGACDEVHGDEHHDEVCEAQVHDEVQDEQFHDVPLPEVHDGGMGHDELPQ